MIIPGILYYIVFKYVPLAGSVIAFQDYQIFKGILGSPWVGLDNFGFIFSYQDFYNVLRNTAVIAFYQLVLVFRPRSCWLCCSMKSASCWRSGLCKACSISRTFIMGRCRRDRFRAVVQPRRCECGAGLVRLRTHSVHAGGAVFPRDCRPVLDLEGSWLGHDYLFGAIAGINPNLYEAAVMDGASRWKQTIYITLPTMFPTILVLFLLQIGNFLELGFDQIYNLLTPMTYSVGDIIETYVYRAGVLQGNTA